VREITPYQLHSPARVGEADYFSYAESDEVHLRDYWRMVVKRRRVVILVFLIVLGLGIYKTFSQTPLYTAVATLKIEPQTTAIQIGELLTPGEDVGGPYDYYQTQFALLKSRPLAAKVITELKLASNPDFLNDESSLFDRIFSWPFELIDSLQTYIAQFFRSPPAKTEERSPREQFEFGVSPGLISHYLSLLTVEPVRNTRLVRIMFSTPSPRLSQQLANIHAAAFIRTTLETRFELTNETREFLEKKLAELQVKNQQAEEALQHFRQKHGVVSLEGNENIIVERMVDLNKRLTEARAKRIEQEALYRTVENKNSRYLSEIIDNNVIQQLKTSLLTLEGEQARLSATFTPAHPRLIELGQQLNETRRRLDREIANVVRKIESDYEAARAKEQALQMETSLQEQAALNLKEVGAEYSILKQQVDSSRTLYDNVLKRLNETNISNDAPLSNIQISERAEAPRSPSSPRTQLNLLVATACGLFLGVGLAFFLEYVDQRMSTPEDVWRATGVPTLGVVPHTRSLRRRIYGLRSTTPRRSLVSGVAPSWALQGRSVNQQLMIAHHPHSIFSESYRIIQTMLLPAFAEKPLQVILLTSAHPGEGKTVTTVNLATTLAQSGHTVVVVDADLRKGSCHTLLGRRNHRGLSQVLAGRVSLEEALQNTSIAGLTFLARGALTPNPAGLLQSHRMWELVETLRGRFEFILIDSAPAIAVSDAALLSRLSDGVLLVLRGQRTTIETARRVVERLEAVHAQILGVVLNAVDIRNPDYADYRRYYASYYTAVQKEAEEASEERGASRQEGA
jgi:capsular exopolysaccharide synthesis family protein